MNNGRELLHKGFLADDRRNLLSIIDDYETRLRRMEEQSVGISGIGGIVIADHTLTADTSSGAEYADVSRVPAWAQGGELYVVIAPGSVNTEVRKLGGSSTNQISFDTDLDNDHYYGDGVLFVYDFRGVNAQWFGAKGDDDGSQNGTDDSAALQAAIDELASTDIKTIFFPGSQYRVDSGLAISDYGYRFIGMHHRRPSASGTETGATRLNYYGTGEMFEIGTDPAPDAYDSGDYDGYHDQGFEWLTLKYSGSSTTALGNGAGNYGTGTYAIRDWKGGSINLDHVWIENFEYGFWGIQSDYNEFSDVWVRYCNVGAYLGPRCDQFVGKSCTFSINDTGLMLDRCEGAAFYSCRFQFSGTSTEWTIDIGSTFTSRGSVGHAFYSCWFEHGASANNDIDSFVRIGYLGGSDDNQQTLGVSFYNPHVINIASGNYRASYFATVANATEIAIIQPAGRWTNFDDLAEYVGATNPEVFILGNFTMIGGLNLVETGSGTPRLAKQAYGNSMILRSDLGRVYVDWEPPDADREMYISAPGDYNPAITFPNHASGNTQWINYGRRRRSGTAAPVSGTWLQGDVVWNTAPTAGGTLGWVCTTGGSPGTWKVFGSIAA